MRQAITSTSRYPLSSLSYKFSFSYSSRQLYSHAHTPVQLSYVLATSAIRPIQKNLGWILEYFGSDFTWNIRNIRGVLLYFNFSLYMTWFWGHELHSFEKKKIKYIMLIIIIMIRCTRDRQSMFNVLSRSSSLSLITFVNLKHAFFLTLFPCRTAHYILYLFLIFNLVPYNFFASSGIPIHSILSAMVSIPRSFRGFV